MPNHDSHEVLLRVGEHTVRLAINDDGALSATGPNSRVIKRVLDAAVPDWSLGQIGNLWAVVTAARAVEKKLRNAQIIEAPRLPEEPYVMPGTTP